MSVTYDVRFWEIKTVKGRRRPYGVRWVTGPKQHSEYFATKALANSRRSELVQAARRGEPFDVESGLPITQLREQRSMSLLQLATSYMDMKWPTAAAKTR